MGSQSTTEDRPGSVLLKVVTDLCWEMIVRRSRPVTARTHAFWQTQDKRGSNNVKTRNPPPTAIHQHAYIFNDQWRCRALHL